MKSMAQMQAEMLARARWDGGYPKAVHMFPGLIAMAHSEEEERRLRRSNVRILLTAIPAGIALPLLVAWLIG